MYTKKQIETNKPLHEIIEELEDDFNNDFRGDDMSLDEDIRKFPSLKTKWIAIKGKYVAKYRELDKKVQFLLSRESIEKVKINKDLRHNKEAADYIKYNSELYKNTKDKMKDIEVILDMLTDLIVNANNHCFALKVKVDLQKIEES